MQDFRRLLVWHRAHTLALDMHRAIDAFPRGKCAELKAQMRRATESIANNIVEGCAAASRKEFARYLDISIKSASEVDYQLQLAHDLGAIDTATWQPLAREVVDRGRCCGAYGARFWQLRARGIRGRTTQPGVTLKPDTSN
jgi:four helix bundle protein